MFMTSIVKIVEIVFDRILIYQVFQVKTRVWIYLAFELDSLLSLRMSTYFYLCIISRKLIIMEVTIWQPQLLETKTWPFYPIG